MTIVTDPGNPRIQAVFLRAHVRLLASGLKPPRGLSKKVILARCTEITGHYYKTSECSKAYGDLNTFIRSFDNENS